MSDDHDYRALFAHVGVSDLTDWQTVALRLAEKHVPEVLQGTVPQKRGPGRPWKWDAFSGYFARQMVREAIAASKTGTIPRPLKGKKDTCRFLTERTPLATEWRDRFGIPQDATFHALYNRVVGDDP